MVRPAASAQSKELNPSVAYRLPDVMFSSIVSPIENE